MMDIRAVAWDIDGTMLDSEPLHHRALIAVSARYGVRIAADDKRFVGVGMDQVWLCLCGQYPADLSEDNWMQQIIGAYVADVQSLAVHDGLINAIMAFREAGIAQCCVSNSARAIVDANIARLGISELISFSISRGDTPRGKPDPEPYSLACRRFEVAPEHVLCFEDSQSGSASAVAAGCRLLRYGVDFLHYDSLLAGPPFAELLWRPSLGAQL